MKNFYILIGLIFLLGCDAAQSRQLSIIPAISTLPSTDTLTLLFVGDIMCHKPQITSAKIGEEYDFDKWFEFVAPIIAKADLAFGNLETTLAEEGPFSGYPRFKSPDTLANALHHAGFDVLVTSNNHSNDTRAPGLIHTIKTLKQLGKHQTGTFINAIDRDLHYPLMINKDGFRIVLLNYTYDTNGIPTPKGVHVNLIDTTQIKQDITDALDLEPDLLLAFMHWGREYNIKADKNQKQLSRMMLEAGVDHIIGSHPHVVQPVDLVSINNRKHLVAYSLGNFISNQRKHLTDGGIILEMQLVRANDRTELLNYQYIPIWRYLRFSGGKVNYEILPISQFENDTSHFHSIDPIIAMGKYAKHIRNHLLDIEERDIVP